MPELQIIGGPQSNYVRVARIASAEKGVPYTLIPVMPHTPEVDAIHPFGKIPVMRHGDVTLGESRAICFYIDHAFARRKAAGQINNLDDIVAAHMEGTVQRVRPKLMTMATMLAGLVPLLWATGSGAEVMKRMAAPMVGGLITSALLTLEIVPVVYTYWRQEQLLWERLAPLDPRFAAARTRIGTDVFARR